MNEISLLFYGSLSELSSQLFYKMGIVELRPATAERSGYYILESRFGKETLRKVNLNFEENEGEDWIIYRYLSQEEIQRLQENSNNRRVYVFLQNYINFDYIMSHSLAESSLFYFVVSTVDGEFKTLHNVGKDFKSKNICHIRKPQRIEKKTEESRLGGRLPSFLFAPLKFLLNPVDELNRISIFLRYSNLRLLRRFVELFHFLFFVLLMFFYKTWGLVVDTVNLLKRFGDLLLLRIYYKSIHLNYHEYLRPLIRFVWVNILVGGYYGFVNRFYYQGVHKLYHGYVKLFSTYVWTMLLVPFYYGLIKIVYYNGIHRFYNQFVKRITTFVWVNISVPTRYGFVRGYHAFINRFYYQGVHKLYHGYIKIFVTYIWTKLLVPFYYGFIRIVYFQGIHRFYNQFVKKIITFVWVKVFIPIRYGIARGYHAIIERFYYQGVHKLYHRYIKIFLTYIWTNFLVPVYYGFIRIVYFQGIHRFYNQFVKKIITFVWVNVFIPIRYGFVQVVYYKGAHKIYNSYLKKIMQYVYYSSLHLFFHDVIKPIFSFIYYKGPHLLYHRVLVKFVTLVWLKVICPVYYNGLQKLYYGGFHKLYYSGLHKFYYVVLKEYAYYRIWGWIRGVLYIQVRNFFVYSIRHYLLMFAYKCYGLAFDSITLFHRIIKLYLMYPIFKIYWFSKFQYIKRVKKYFI